MPSNKDNERDELNKSVCHSQKSHCTLERTKVCICPWDKHMDVIVLLLPVSVQSSLIPEPFTTRKSYSLQQPPPRSLLCCHCPQNPLCLSTSHPQEQVSPSAQLFMSMLLPHMLSTCIFLIQTSCPHVSFMHHVYMAHLYMVFTCLIHVPHPHTMSIYLIYIFCLHAVSIFSPIYCVYIPHPCMIATCLIHAPYPYTMSTYLGHLLHPHIMSTCFAHMPHLLTHISCMCLSHISHAPGCLTLSSSLSCYLSEG